MAPARAVFLLLTSLALSTLEARTGGSVIRAAGDNFRFSTPHQVSGRAGRGDEADTHVHGGEATTTCAISKVQLLLAFNEVALELNVTGLNGEVCSLPVQECHQHDDKDDRHDKEDHHGNKDSHAEEMDHDSSGSGGTDSQCVSIYDTCVDLLLHTNLTSESCLTGECEQIVQDDNTTSSNADSRPSTAEAYGYGFLMVCLVSLGSLLGILVVPLITKKALVYKYTYFFMIALGMSALLCDAVLHLLPHAWNLHGHAAQGTVDTQHNHAEDDAHGKTVEEFLWKGSIALFAVYLFYLLEFMLHSFISHTHSHGFPTDTVTSCQDNGQECIQLDATLPHSQCAGTSSKGRILHPTESGAANGEPCLMNESGAEVGASPTEMRKGVRGFLSRIKPLAWLIVVGDGLHNFADGLALGAAISQSLSLGISTTIALIFHEIPHEFGDYVILLSTGLTWYAALLFNFISALTAVIGFFVGVAVGTESEELNGWILAFAAGLFVYIALVDLLPELIHSKEKGLHRWGLFFAANVGFFLSFVALFLIAVYEDDLDNLISD